MTSAQTGETSGDDRDLRLPSEMHLSDRLILGLVDSAPDGLIIADDRGVIVLVNQQTEQMFGYDRDDLLGQTVEKLLPDDVRDLHVSHRDGYRDQPEPRPMGIGLGLQGRAKDGTLFPVEISLSPLQADDGAQLVIAAVRDISDRLRTEAELSSALQRAVVVADRERVARDMHDNVIQELFATGMSLEATATRLDDAETVDRLVKAVDSIDQVIMQIRSTIFGLRSHNEWGDGVQGQILTVLKSASEALGFEPSVSFIGPVEALDDPVVENLSAIVREALSNTARHADASMVNVTIEVTDDRIELLVVDNGAGISVAIGDHVGQGLRNMSERAVSLGGACEVAAEDGGGTRVLWQVPR